MISRKVGRREGEEKVREVSDEREREKHHHHCSLSIL